MTGIPGYLPVVSPVAVTFTRTGSSQQFDKSCGVLKHLGPQMQWLESYVPRDNVYYAYFAPDEVTVRERAGQGGFPADRIAEINFQNEPETPAIRLSAFPPIRREEWPETLQ